MFNFLKKAFSKFTKKAEESAQPAEEAKPAPEVKQEVKPELPREIKEKLPPKAETPATVKEKSEPARKADTPVDVPQMFEPAEEKPAEKPKVSWFKKREPKRISLEQIHAEQERDNVPKELKKVEEKQSWLSNITRSITDTKISEASFEKLFSSLELELLQNNVALEVVEKIKANLKAELVGKLLKRLKLSEAIHNVLKDTLVDILDYPKQIDLLALSEVNKPLILLFVGVNGVGKTTNMAKLAHMFQKSGKTVVFAAADTFRAASIEQLEYHANKLGIHMIKHQYGADPAAVAFDAVKHAKAKGVDVVMIDTAGRQQANDDLMNELAKIKRVVQPTATILVVDALTGNDAVEQARLFDEKIGVDGVLISKADADEKGGALISVVFTTKKPIAYIGTGQNYDDIKLFKTEDFLGRIL